MPHQAPFIAIWQYRIKQEQLDPFLRAYGPNGIWASLFRRADGYVRTILIRASDDPMTFLTVDQWTSQQHYTNFRENFAAEYAALDKACNDFTESEERLAEGFVCDDNISGSST